MRPHLRDPLTDDLRHPEMTCPSCGEIHDAAQEVHGGASRPVPGSLLICVECGAIGELLPTGTLKLLALKDVADPETRATIAKMQRAVASRMPRGYVRAVARLANLLGAAIARGEAPRFAMPDKGVLVAAGLDEIGRALARNAAAHAFIDAALNGQSIAKGPTVNMLRAALSVRGIETEEITIAELRAKGLLMVTELGNMQRTGGAS